MIEVKKYSFIDALRGWAVAGVIFAHTPCPPEMNYLFSFVGGKGVQLFYILSALTLCLSLSQKRRAEANPIKNFFIRRFFRIAPMFYVAFAIFMFLNGTGPSYWAPDGLAWWHIVTTLTFTNGWHPETLNTIVFGGWSIADEMMFYAIFPALFAFIQTPTRAIVLTLISLVVGIYLSALAFNFWFPVYGMEHLNMLNWFVELWLPAQLSVFTLGFCLFFAFQRLRSEGPPKLKIFKPPFFAFLTLVACFGIPQLSFIPARFGFALFFVMLTYLLAMRPYKLMVNRFFIYLGKISFSVYLLHSLGIRVGTWLSDIFKVMPETYAQTAVVLSVTIPLTVAAASFTYRYVEVVGMDYSKRVIDFLESREASKQAFLK